MDEKTFHVGAVFPHDDFNDDPVMMRDFAQAAEGLGYSHLTIYDHVIGANPASRPGWNRPVTIDSVFHEPLVLISHLAAATKKIGFLTGVVILPQRQTVLFAKQAANADVFCGGRLRLGVGIGWNDVEYEALGVPFVTRGRRFDDQIAVLRKLWTERAVTIHTAHHHITDAGILPLPVQRPIPLWIGGTSHAAISRAATTGDGWLPIIAADKAEETIVNFRAAVRRAGRDPDRVPVENIVSFGFGGKDRSAETIVAELEAWRKAGAAGASVHTMGMGLKTGDAHIALLRRVAEMFRR